MPKSVTANVNYINVAATPGEGVSTTKTHVKPQATRVHDFPLLGSWPYNGTVGPACLQFRIPSAVVVVVVSDENMAQSPPTFVQYSQQWACLWRVN
jgi:hypothetical protein